MGRGRRSAGGRAWKGESSSSGASEEEMLWEPYVYFDKGKQLNVAMAGWEMADSEMERWCSWFRDYMKRIAIPSAIGSVGSEQVAAREVNFAENQLSSDGVRRLVRTLSDCQVVVHVLKLNHNQLEDGCGVAELLGGCRGTLRELHLSHNRLSTAAAIQIIQAAAAVQDEQGAYCYPRQVGTSVVPLWLRMQHNLIDSALLSEQLEEACSRLQRTRSAVLCSATNKACTPHSCMRHRGCPSAVHAKQLVNQRRKHPAGEAQDAAAQPEEEASDQSVVGACTVQLSDEGNSDVAAESCAAVALAEAPAIRIVDATNWRLCHDSGEACQATVLRWDEDHCRWVQDVIEVPVRVKPEVNAAKEVIARELRDLIGIRNPQESGGQCSSSFRVSSSRHPKFNGVAAAVTAARENRTAGEHILRCVTAPNVRRGTQPSGGEVYRANGTHHFKHKTWH